MWEAISSFDEQEEWANNIVVYNLKEDAADAMLNMISKEKKKNQYR